MSSYHTNKLQIQKSAAEEPGTARQKISISINQTLYITLTIEN